MERRSFVKTGMLGAVGLPIATQPFSHLLQPASSTSTTFKQFSQLCKGQKRWRWLLPEALQHCIARYTEEVAVLGYSGAPLSVFLAGNEQFCFYPMRQPNGATAEGALIVPVFHKNKSGQWSKTAVLHQFEIAALVQMTQQETFDFQPDYTQLLPTGIIADPQGKAAFKTANGGYWKVKTSCKSSEITCTTQLVQPDGTHINTQNRLIHAV